MTYRPREFWEQRLGEQFDLAGTGETTMSAAFNRACYTLRAETLARALAHAGFDPRGRSVLDVGCGTGFWTEYYRQRGARYTGLDLTQVSVQRLAERYPEFRFVQADVSDAPLAERYDLVNAFDVLYHVTDEARWERAVANLAGAVAPGGLLLVTDVFAAQPNLSEHNVMRPLSRYLEQMAAAGLERVSLSPTHVLLNRPLGPWRFLNRLPWLLLAADRVLLAMGLGLDDATNKLLVCRRPA